MPRCYRRCWHTHTYTLASIHPFAQIRQISVNSGGSRKNTSGKLLMMIMEMNRQTQWPRGRGSDARAACTADCTRFAAICGHFISTQSCQLVAIIVIAFARNSKTFYLKCSKLRRELQIGSRKFGLPRVGAAGGGMACRGGEVIACTCHLGVGQSINSCNAVCLQCKHNKHSSASKML